MPFELCDCTNTLLREISDKRMRRKDVALTYKLAIRSSENVDWPKVNTAIIERWSMAGLLWIKKMAWKPIREHPVKYSKKIHGNWCPPRKKKTV